TCLTLRYGSGHPFRRLWLLELGQSEVRELGISVLRDENVLRLDVAVEDACSMGGGQSVGNPDEQLEDLPPVSLAAESPIVECAAIDQFRREVLAPLKFACIVNGQNMRMVQRR